MHQAAVQVNCYQVHQIYQASCYFQVQDQLYLFFNHKLLSTILLVPILLRNAPLIKQAF